MHYRGCDEPPGEELPGVEEPGADEPGVEEPGREPGEDEEPGDEELGVEELGDAAPAGCTSIRLAFIWLPSRTKCTVTREAFMAARPAIPRSAPVTCVSSS
jgi:hypothetical protein